MKRQGLCKFDRPQQNFTYDPNMLRSNYQIDYIPHDLPEKEQRKKDDAAGSGQPFNGTSDYRMNYVKYWECD